MSTLAPTRPQTFPVLLVAAWFAAAYLLADAGAFVGTADEPPWRIGLAILVPIGAAGLALWLSPTARTWARSLDLQLLITMQAWRYGGFAFIALWAAGLLPAGFALPAGLGDIAIATAAPFVARHTAAHGPTRVFYAWTALGILDLVVAVTLGILNSPGPFGLLAGDPTTAVVDTFPVALIPAFGVPLMIVLHLLSLARVRST
ncbi:MAG TPA: hypothetical protein VGX25_31830 [Actinophytocola sp.]|uniref:hypothetical protein n=1 Tax=Actinophytocola sp. TaxID=1872138 RepID=UPI002DDC94DF|nr:hypothetical protein [Actinophytocola sp.]HEV2784002.1 hypothetical protein [Actinophytocola sp.]